MLIGRDRISLKGKETYCTLYAEDAFCVNRGSVNVYIVAHTQEEKTERRVRICRAESNERIPAFCCRMEDDEVWCFALEADDAGAELIRIPFEEAERKRFAAAHGVFGYDFEGFEGGILQYYEAYVPESERPEPVVVDEGNAYPAGKPDESLCVESGAVHVFLQPVTAEGVHERRAYLCRVTPQDEFAIPGMDYQAHGRTWQLHIAAESGTAVLRKMMCTDVAREKFVKAVWKQSDREQDVREMREVYRIEGPEESLIQYYIKRNDLADFVREYRQKRHKEKLTESVDRAAAGENDSPPDSEQEDRDEALLRALEYLCARGGIELAQRQELRRRCPGMTLPEIARVSGFICREVVLEDGWFRSDCGLLMGVLDGSPAACVPVRGGYRMLNGETGEETKLDARSARQIHPRAYSVRRGLPAKALKYKDVLKYIVSGIRPGDAVWMVLSDMFCVFAGLLIPWLSLWVCDRLIPMGSVDMLAQMCLVVGTFMLGNVCFTLVKKFCRLQAAVRAGYDLQDAVYARIFELPEGVLHRYESGDLAQRAQSFSGLVNRLIDRAASAGISAVLALAYLIQMACYAESLVPGALLMLAAYGLLAGFVSALAVGDERTEEEKNGEAAGRLQQYFSGIQKIRMAGVEERAVLEYIRPVSQQTTPRTRRIAALVSVIRDAGGITLSMALFVLMICCGAGISVGRLIAFAAAFGALSSSVLSFADELVGYYLLRPKIDRLMPLLECVPETNADGKLEHVDSLEGGVTFEHVTFSYSKDGGQVLSDVSFDVRPGEYVGIVGRSGSGKSTILKLLLGFETPQAGRVLYDGRDIASLDRHSLRKRLGVVLQNGSLISGSIYENIVITSEKPCRAAAEAAAEIAGLKEDIEAMPMQLDTMISESAGTVSGGQKQRILIARAVAGRPDVMLLDEATSALDNLAQEQVCRSLERMNVTRIVIAHRLSTIENCDRILVLDEGRIVEEGNYRELYARRGLFYEMARRQLAGTDEENVK